MNVFSSSSVISYLTSIKTEIMKETLGFSSLDYRNQEVVFTL